MLKKSCPNFALMDMKISGHKADNWSHSTWPFATGKINYTAKNCTCVALPSSSQLNLCRRFEGCRTQVPPQDCCLVSEPELLHSTAPAILYLIISSTFLLKTDRLTITYHIDTKSVPISSFALSPFSCRKTQLKSQNFSGSLLDDGKCEVCS